MTSEAQKIEAAVFEAVRQKKTTADIGGPWGRARRRVGDREGRESLMALAIANCFKMEVFITEEA